MKKKIVLCSAGLLLIAVLFVNHFLVSMGSVTFTVNGEEHTYKANTTATVASGAYEGLGFSFYGDDSAYPDTLTFDWPSNASFAVGERWPEFVYQTPELPFTLTDETFADLYSDRLQGPVYSVLRWTERSDSDSALFQTSFTDFEIEVDSFGIKNQKLSLSGTFWGRTTQADPTTVAGSDPQSIQGHFEMQNVPLSIMSIE